MTPNADEAGAANRALEGAPKEERGCAEHAARFRKMAHVPGGPIPFFSMALGVTLTLLL